jgi:DNA polymerase III delta prime subunit
MHSFLIVGNNSEIVESKISELLKKYSLKRIDFDGQKIEEIRKLNSFTSLSLKDKTAIVITNIEKSTNEAANAFLKSLEEPQDNLYFLLTTSSIHKVLPTIISRCQIIYVSQKRVPEDVSNLEKFLNMKPSEKLFFLERIKKRDEAIYFFENLMFFIHQKIKEDEVNLNIFSKILETAQETLSRLEKNGNVNIQLTYFVVNTDNFDSSTHLGHEV